MVGRSGRPLILKAAVAGTVVFHYQLDVAGHEALPPMRLASTMTTAEHTSAAKTRMSRTCQDSVRGRHGAPSAYPRRTKASPSRSALRSTAVLKGTTSVTTRDHTPRTPRKNCTPRIVWARVMRAASSVSLGKHGHGHKGAREKRSEGQTDALERPQERGKRFHHPAEAPPHGPPRARRQPSRTSAVQRRRPFRTGP